MSRVQAHAALHGGEVSGKQCADYSADTTRQASPNHCRRERRRGHRRERGRPCLDVLLGLERQPGYHYSTARRGGGSCLQAASVPRCWKLSVTPPVLTDFELLAFPLHIKQTSAANKRAPHSAGKCDALFVTLVVFVLLLGPRTNSRTNNPGWSAFRRCVPLLEKGTKCCILPAETLSTIANPCGVLQPRLDYCR